MSATTPAHEPRNPSRLKRAIDTAGRLGEGCATSRAQILIPLYFVRHLIFNNFSVLPTTLSL